MLELHFVSFYSPILICSVVSSKICVNSQVMIAWTAKGTLEGEFYRFGFDFVGIALSLSHPHFSRSFHVISFMTISCYASSAYSTSTVILNQAELPSDGHDEEKGDGDVEPLHAAVRF